MAVTASQAGSTSPRLFSCLSSPRHLPAPLRDTLATNFSFSPELASPSDVTTFESVCPRITACYTSCKVLQFFVAEILNRLPKFLELWLNVNVVATALNLPKVFSRVSKTYESCGIRMPMKFRVNKTSRTPNLIGKPYRHGTSSQTELKRSKGTSENSKHYQAILS